MNSCDILYICGVPFYNQSISGNGVILNILNSLGESFNVKKIALNWNAGQRDDFVFSTDSLLDKSNNWLKNNIPNHKILFLVGDDLTNDQLVFINKYFKSQTVVYVMTNWLFGDGDQYPELNKSFHGEASLKRLNAYKQINCHILNASSHCEKVQSISLFKDIDSSLIPLPFNQIHVSEPIKEKDTSNRVILWGTTQPQTRRKGLKEFEDILKILKEKYPKTSGVKIHTAGPDPKLNCPFEVINKGLLDQSGMSLAYQGANVFALTTLADGGPMMAAESIKNKTPLVSFNTNVSMDITSNGINGYTVDSNEDFADKLYVILYESDFEISYDFIKKFNSEEIVLNKYKNLFSGILNK
jgi:glycosyltransferase involved in cell wall biosynthesis